MEFAKLHPYLKAAPATLGKFAKMHPLLTAAVPTLAGAYYLKRRRNGSLTMPSLDVHPSTYSFLNRDQMLDWLGKIINDLNSVTKYLPADNLQRTLLDTSIKNLIELQVTINDSEKEFYESFSKIKDETVPVFTGGPSVASSVGFTPDAALQDEL